MSEGGEMDVGKFKVALHFEDKIIRNEDGSLTIHGGEKPLLVLPGGEQVYGMTLVLSQFGMCIYAKEISSVSAEGATVSVGLQEDEEPLFGMEEFVTPEPPPRKKWQRRKNPMLIYGETPGKKCGTCVYYCRHPFVPDHNYNRCSKNNKSNHLKTWPACKLYKGEGEDGD